MKNEKGITLIELLGVLVILGIVLTLIGSIMVNSLKTSDRATTEQRLQQEANYITEKIRSEYLKKPDDPEEGKISDSFKLEIDNDEKQLTLIDNDENKLPLEGIVISEGYLYCYKEDINDKRVEDMSCDNTDESNPIVISRIDNEEFIMTLVSKDQKPYTIKTIFSKLK